mmetsp:Transcript_29485/g.33775  ORF Transcript_29485/g.33775 Transcript_29485/m.33775 type:complete len:167 (-) Transcript_29485:95-595(-)
MELLLDFYQKLCDQEKEKLKKIKELVKDREEMLVKINSMLDVVAKPPKRPQTALVRPKDSLKSPLVADGSLLESKAKEEEDITTKCKICKENISSISIRSYKNIEFFPGSTEISDDDLKLLMTNVQGNGGTLDQIYQLLLDDLKSMDATTIYPECKTTSLKPYDFA